ncbi:MAG: hypothetical protein Q9163_002557 [Psora crenata]
MGIRVVARVRPQQKKELGEDAIVTTTNGGERSLVKIPNPKNESEAFSFQFSGVYDHTSTQQELFDHEIYPNIKHLFQGFDVTIFAYGSTGTGKTHTMRGGKSLADRGIIPRLLSGVFRRARKIMKDSEGATSVGISLSYYEIYNDKVFDLFEMQEKRSIAGLPLRDNGGKTVVVGLTERPCESLKEFERLYDEANNNRSTSATKLNPTSSRSHAILRLKLSVSTGDQVRTSTASAIDLAGSEDNRRTENGKERMVESASINKSLFTLAKCVEAIGQGQGRIPYRESKMTRILSLGQNNGFTMMILNLAPSRSYHLDTLSSLNFANRTKTIEVREVENEPVFKGCTRAVPSFAGLAIQRQPLRPLASTVYNASVEGANTTAKRADRPSKAFNVYSDKERLSNGANHTSQLAGTKQPSPKKRVLDPTGYSALRHVKRPALVNRCTPAMSKQAIEEMIERKVTNILAAKALDQPSIAPQTEISEEVQRRLDMLEKKVGENEDGRQQGLAFLLMAKQHVVRGEDASALRMYRLAKDFFPGNKRLEAKIEKLQWKMEKEKPEAERREGTPATSLASKGHKSPPDGDADTDVLENAGESNRNAKSDGDIYLKAKCAKRRPPQVKEDIGSLTPRSRHLLDIINTRDVVSIRKLKGVGAKKAESIIAALTVVGEGGEDPFRNIASLQELSMLKGVGSKTVENMRAGLL